MDRHVLRKTTNLQTSHNRKLDLETRYVRPGTLQNVHEPIAGQSCRFPFVHVTSRNRLVKSLMSNTTCACPEDYHDFVGVVQLPAEKATPGSTDI